jgi:hypothetical protein
MKVNVYFVSYQRVTIDAPKHLRENIRDWSEEDITKVEEMAKRVVKGTIPDWELDVDTLYESWNHETAYSGACEIAKSST